MVPIKRRPTSHISSGFFVYLLFSLKDKGWYIGYTEDIEKRISDHNNGNVTSTKHRLPIKLIHYEYFINKQDAKAREIFLKSGFGRDQLRKSLKQTLQVFEI